MMTVVQSDHKSSAFNHRILFATLIHIYTLAMSCMSKKKTFNVSGAACSCATPVLKQRKQASAQHTEEPTCK